MAYQGDDSEFQTDLIETNKEILKVLKALLYNIELITDAENSIDNIEDI